MPFKTDNGGKALCLPDCKSGCGTWGTRLSQIGRYPEKQIYIATYSLPDLEYIYSILDKRPTGKNVTLLCHSKFIRKARTLKKRYPDMDIYISDTTHAKLVLVEPQTVWLGSWNFGKSGWFETGIGIHSEEAYEDYKNQLFHHLKTKAIEI